MNSEEQHEVYVSPKKYGPDCWTTESYNAIIDYLHKDYPIGGNHTCFIEESSSIRNDVSYGSCPAAVLFYLTVVSGSVAAAGVMIMIIISIIHFFFSKYAQIEAFE
jgi:hypothetical protein